MEGPTLVLILGGGSHSKLGQTAGAAPVFVPRTAPEGHDLRQIQYVPQLIERYTNVLALRQPVLGIVGLERSAEGQVGVELAGGRHELLQTGGLGISVVGIPLTVFVDERLEVAKGVGASRFQRIQHEGMHQHALHPFD